jgi:hypothetical protein
MTPRLLSVLTVASIVAVAAAGYSVSQERGFETVTVGSKVFPGLRDKLNEVTELKLLHNARQMTLIRKDKYWSMVESDGYIAEFKNIQKVLFSLADLVYVEAKTKKPDLLKKLDLRDPKVKESRGRHVTVFGANKKPLVDVILGKTRYNMPGSTRDGIYFRFPGKDQAWLAIGQLEASKSPSDWLKTRILSVAGETIEQAIFTHPDGEAITVRKSSVKDIEFDLIGIPFGKKLKYKTDPKNMGTVLEDLNLKDVRKSNHFDFSGPKTIKATFQTFDGLKVNVLMIERVVPTSAEGEEDNLEFWAIFEATGEGAKALIKAKQITDQTQGWAFQLPAYKASRLNKRLKDIIEDIKVGSQ